MQRMKFRLKELRQERNLTIDNVAGLTGLSRGFISQLENGKREPSTETLQQVAAAFHVGVNELLVDAGPQDAAISELVAAFLELPADQMPEVLRFVRFLKDRAETQVKPADPHHPGR